MLRVLERVWTWDGCGLAGDFGACHLVATTPFGVLEREEDFGFTLSFWRRFERVSEPSPVYTIDQALSAMGFGKFQGFVLAYAGLGWVAEAMEMMILSFVGPAVKYEWALSPSEESLITTAVFAGMLLGAYSWGLISDHFGRRKGLLSIAIVTSGAGFLSVFSPNYVSLVVLRCLVGFGLGGGPAHSSWFLEFVAVPNRGTWMVIFSTFWTFGTVLEASLAWSSLDLFYLQFLSTESAASFPW